jgi:NAD-dependent dihydropyrimidine dehydrogenase PreA subunit
MPRRKGKFVVDEAKCKGCSLCVIACPNHALELGKKLNKMGYHPVQFVETKACTACGVCFYACPEPSAITVFKLDDGDEATEPEVLKTKKRA